MDSLNGDTEDGTEDSPGRKKSKIKSLKTRLFGRSKRAAGEGNGNLSQSAGDITAGQALRSDEDLACSPGTLGSRALSHDSIFLGDEVLTDAEPARISSQENVHSKIKSLQMKLQQQKMHLGPPPLVLPVRQPDDPKSRSEDDSLLHAPTATSRDVTTQGAHSKTTSRPFSPPLLPILQPAPLKSAARTTSNPLPVSVTANSSAVEPPLDFSSPAQFTPCLDNSAARHRMSIKPKNQRTATKKRVAANDSRSHVLTLNNIDYPECVSEEELSAKEEVTIETEQGAAVIGCTSECPSKPPEAVLITQEETSTLSSLTLSKQDQAPPGSEPPQVFRVKPHRPADVLSSERPHSSVIPSGLKEKEEGLEKPVMSHDKRSTLNKAEVTQLSSDQLSTALSSVVAIKSSSVQQQIQTKTENTGGRNRPAQGSGSFHFSINTVKNRDGERPRSSSFVGVLEQTEARQRTEGKPVSKDLQPKGGPIVMGALRNISGTPWDRKDSLKKVDSVASSKDATTNTGAVEVESSQEVEKQAKEAREVAEEEGKTAFGIKLRSTSLSLRFRSNTSSCEEQCDKQKGNERSDNANDMCKKPSTNISCTPPTAGDLRQTDPASSGFSLPVKQTSPSTCEPLNMPKEVQTACQNPKDVETARAIPQDPKPAPQTAPSEVSWMTLAREKTKSLQQLFTSKFPKDFTSMQAAARPQAQVQTPDETETPAGTQVHTPTVKIQQIKTPLSNQPSNDAVQAETVQSRSQAQAVKPSLMAVQQKTSGASPSQSNIAREPPTSKQTNEPQSHANTIPSAAQSVQINPRTTQSPVLSSAQTETSSHFAQGSVTQSPAQSCFSSSQQQVPWSNRSLHPVKTLQSTTPSPASVSDTASATAPPSASALGRMEGEATVQENVGISVPGRHAIWVGSVSEKAAFLEKRAVWTTTPGTKGVEMKKDRTEAQTSGESPASDKTAPPTKDTQPEGGQGVKPAGSSPAKVPDRPREDKWLRRNVQSSPSPSSSPTIPSTLQSMSDSGQPSWMELAKRKSMAWSDKSMH